jgi:hypothetical protein
MDRVLKDAGVHQLLVERDEFRAELEQAREALHLELLEIDHMLHLFGDPEFEPLRSIVVTLRALRAELTKEDERG